MKIALVHSKLTWYRIPLFQRLSEMVNRIDFLLTQPSFLPIYTACGKGVEITTIPPLKATVKAFRPFRMFAPYPQTISPGVMLDVMRCKYGILIWGENILALEGWALFFWTKVFRRKFIVWSDEWSWKKPFLRRLISPITNYIFRHADAIITHGQRHRQYFASLGIPDERIFIVGSVSFIRVTPKDLAQSEILRRNLGLSGKLVILYVGGLVERKGVVILIKAFSILRSKRTNVALVIVGDGPMKREYAKLVRDLRLNDSVFFTGWVEHSKIAPYYLICDVLVLPSVTIWQVQKGSEGGAEPWGLVLNEAMSVGKAVIATTAVGGAYDLIQQGINGYIVPEGDIHALYKALRKVTSSFSTLAEMGRRSKQIVDENFTYDSMAKGFLKAIKYVATQG